MKDALKPLLESGIISEDTQQLINEAWESQLSEAREQVRSELREEFSQKYEHDKSVMVEALDKMMTEGLEGEIAEFREERQAMYEDRVAAKQQLRENASKFNQFMTQKLAEEIGELRRDRQLQLENQNKLEQFVVRALASEIKEFAQDKQAVVEAKVKLVSEGRKQLEALKQRFVAESAEKLSRSVSAHLKGELSQLKEDIQAARENQFGRKLFEAFATEFSVTHLNEKAETRSLMSALQEKDAKLQEAIQALQHAKSLVESKEREVKIVKESNQRTKTMSDLLSTLNAEKAETMKTLLEGVETAKLQKAFDKYLPAVLNTVVTESKPQAQKSVLKESIREVTGNKPVTEQKVEVEERDNVIAIKRLAGL